MPFPLITEKSRLTDALHAPTLHTTTARDGLQPFPPPTERAGTLLGNRYKLTQLLGRGGHGLVFGATDTQTQAEVAIKLLARTEEDTDHSRRFLREADIFVFVSNLGDNDFHPRDVLRSEVQFEWRQDYTFFELK